MEKNNYKSSYFSNDLTRQNKVNKGKNTEFKYSKWTSEANNRFKNGSNFIGKKKWVKRRDRKRTSFHDPRYLEDFFDNYDSDTCDVGNHDGYLFDINSDNVWEARAPYMVNEQSCYLADNWENECQKDYYHRSDNQEHWMSGEWIYDEPHHNDNRGTFYDEGRPEVFVRNCFENPYFVPYHSSSNLQDNMLIESKAFLDSDRNDLIRDRSFVEKAIIYSDIMPTRPQQTTILPVRNVISQSDATIPDVFLNHSEAKPIISNETVHDRTQNSFESLTTENFPNINSGVMIESNTSLGPVKHIIYLSKSILYPPNPKAPAPVFGNKPLGCKSVLVKGLPEKATEMIIREIFEQCGEILSVHMNDGDNSCHIKFSNEAFVEKAIYFSGYIINIENRRESPFRGQLEVDYSSNDDLPECKSKCIDSKECLPEKPVKEKKGTQIVIYYSRQEALNIGEKLRGEETFHEAMNTLHFWLERGECNKTNAASFYSMIQSTYSHILRLKKEQFEGENELNRAKLLLKQRTEGNLLKITAINKIFDKACLQKSWAHFTKPQRKKITFWKEQLNKIKTSHVEEMLNERVEDDMDVSDGDDEVVNLSSTFEEDNSKLIEENNFLQYKLEVTQIEMMALQAELKAKDKYISLLKEQLQSKST